ncbi:hypothetical protein EG329_006474 [Mollisiaceae sp. DMI_Dod_QoI]|nr:hypothetical protein EG329_006474 [Helotiales sp. DMI_Dod_QoI]
MSHSTPDNDSKFTYFPKLPIELRNEIWAYMLPQPRVVEVEWHEPTNRYSTRAQSPFKSGIFRICRESRDFAKSKYTLVDINNDINVYKYEKTIEDDSEDAESPLHFVRPGVNSEDTAPTPPFLAYIDFSRETLYFSSNHLETDRESCDHLVPTGAVSAAFLWHLTKLDGVSAKVRHIALANTIADHAYIAPALFKFKRLRSITLIDGDKCCGTWSETQPMFRMDCLAHKPSPRFELKPLPWNTVENGQKFKAVLEEAAKKYEASPEQNDPVSAEEWREVEIRDAWIKREFTDYHMLSDEWDESSLELLEFDDEDDEEEE